MKRTLLILSAALLASWPLAALALVGAPSLIPSKGTWMPAATGYGSSPMNLRLVSDSFTYITPLGTGSYGSNRSSYTGTFRYQNFYLDANAQNYNHQSGYNNSSAAAVGVNLNGFVLAGWQKALDYNTNYQDDLQGYGTALRLGDFHFGYGLEDHNRQGFGAWQTNYQGVSFYRPGVVKISYDVKTENAKKTQDATGSAVTRDESTRQVSVEYLWGQMFLGLSKTDQTKGALKSADNTLGLGYMGLSGWSIVFEMSENQLKESSTKVGASYQLR